MAFAPAAITGAPGKGRLLSIEIDQRQLLSIQERLRAVPRAAPKILARAINQVLSKERTLVLRQISQKIGITQKYLRPQIKLFKARPKTGIGAATSLRGKLWIGSNQISLSKLGMGGSPRNLRIRNVMIRRAIKAGGAFKATMPSGHKGWFVRKERATMRVPGPPGSGTQKHGLPIAEIKAPSPADVMRDIGLDAESEERINRNFGIRIDHEIKRELEKFAQKGR